MSASNTPSAAQGHESALPTEPKYGSSSFWHPMWSGSARPMNPERGDDWATGKGGRPGVGPTDSPPAYSDVKPPWQPWTDHAAMDAELESLRPEGKAPRDKLLRNYVASRVGQIPVAVGELLAENERLSRLLLDVEGSLLAYWTDIPQSEIQRLLPLIREELGDYEPA